MTIEYDGGRFFGWQRQGRRPTVQAAVERAVRRVTGRRAPVVAAGRTDAGVHAEAQVAVFRTTAAIPAPRFAVALNAHLPPTISILRSEEVPDEFHPQRDARGKHYRYVIVNRPARPALDRERCWWIPVSLDLPAMKRAARHLVGRRDFRSFVSDAEERPDTVRTVRRLTLRRRGDRITIDIEGSGFLYNMVRAIVGTLVEVGRGRWSARDVAAILRARDRRRAGPTAPAAGLTLIKVVYS
jgi:tRNA pseudouridine38-40 synthase